MKNRPLLFFLGLVALPASSVAVILGYVSRETLELVIWSGVAVAALWVVGSGFVAPALHYMAACRTHPRERVGAPRPVAKPAPREVYRVERAAVRAGRETV